MLMFFFWNRSAIFYDCGAFAVKSDIFSVLKAFLLKGMYTVVLPKVHECALLVIFVRFTAIKYARLEHFTFSTR